MRAFLAAAVPLALSAGDATPAMDDAQKLAQAMAQVDAEMNAVRAGMAADRASPASEAHATAQWTQEAVAAHATAAAHALAAGDPARSREVDALRVQIADMTELQLGHDAVQETLAARLGGRSGGDPTGAMTFQQGPQGLLWIFWATDAPGAEQLPAQITQLTTAYPQLTVRDLHVVRLTDWRDMLRYLSQVKDYLEAHDPNVSHAEEAARKREYIEANLGRFRALTLMSETRRTGGYLVVEDMTAALAYHVTKVPTEVFLSPHGIVHRIHGIHAQRTLTQWVAACLTWEDQHRAVLEARGVKW